MFTVLLTFAAIALTFLLASAAVLWLTCFLFRVRWPAADGKPGHLVGYRRALVLTFLLTLGSAVVTISAYVLGGPEVAVLINPANWVVVPIVFRLMLPVSVLRAIGVAFVWEILNLVPALAMFLLVPAFVFEAFVLPSGNMAETLYGYNKRIVCPDCGHEFAISATAEAEPSERSLRISSCTCPDCRRNIRLARSLPDGGYVVEVDGMPKELRDLPPGIILDPGVNSGDRVASEKTLLRVIGGPFSRFDLVVFDFPGYPGSPAPTTPVKYVKRIAGLPGETLAIHRGDLFVVDAGDGEAKDRPRHILRKPPSLVLGMMHLVHDSRHVAKDTPRRWVGEGDESPAAPFKLEGERWLHYRHLLRDKPRPQLITDYLGYNSGDPWAGSSGEDWVADLVLECECIAGGDGELMLELSRGPDRFQARFDLSVNACTLLRLAQGRESETLASKPARLPTGLVRLRFANVDERLVVWVDDRLVFGDGVEYLGPERLTPLRENDLERPARVGVRGATVTVNRLRLLRDTYFTTANNHNPQESDVRLDPADEFSWNAFAEAPVSIHEVKPGHYFVLGDNSRNSSDSRMWGLVKQEAISGRVLMRYYPFARFGKVE